MEFKLRPWTMDDVDSLVKHANNYNVAKNMSDVFPHPYTPEHGNAFIQMATTSIPHNILAIDIEGEAVGGTGIHPQHDIYRKNAELGYWLAEPYWGKAIISKAIIQMVDYGFKHWEVTRIFARPFGSNLGSQKALQKAGFTLEAHLHKTFFKNGLYEDELIYAVRRIV